MPLVLLAGTALAPLQAVARHRCFFRFQPSEFGKLLFVLFLAGFLADRARRIGETRTVVEAIALGAVPILLVFVQPDVGTAMVYGAALAAVLFVAGVRWLHMAILGAATVALALMVLPAPAHAARADRVDGLAHVVGSAGLVVRGG